MRTPLLPPLLLLLLPVLVLVLVLEAVVWISICAGRHGRHPDIDKDCWG
jgi:hypothetical protein